MRFLVFTFILASLAYGQDYKPFLECSNSLTDISLTDVEGEYELRIERMDEVKLRYQVSMPLAGDPLNAYADFKKNLDGTLVGLDSRVESHGILGKGLTLTVKGKKALLNKGGVVEIFNCFN